MKNNLDTNEMLFLSEYCGKTRTAWVCHRRNKGDYVAIGYINQMEAAAVPFNNEAKAEDWCEDWVLINDE